MSTKANFTLRGRNPDVLTCIANLSNDEVFTPPELANQMLDTLAEAWAAKNNGANIWADKTVRFLDPCTKSGVFLREITTRLTKGLEKEIPNLEKRVDHILTKQVFGIAITQITGLLARRSLYCSKEANGKHSVAKSFSNADGNIWFNRINHTWDGDKCKYCGTTKAILDREKERENYAYGFIHTDNTKTKFAEFFGGSMQFDVIIGNPPYQMDDGGNGVSAIPIFHKFVDQAKALKPKLLCMIIPSRWYSGGKGLDSFRATMLEDQQMKVIIDYETSKDVFDGVNIAGGICYFVWEADHKGLCEIRNVNLNNISVALRPLNEFPIFIRSNQAISIVHKVLNKTKDVWSDHNYSRNPFGFATNFRGQQLAKKGDIKILTSDGFSFVPRSSIEKNNDLIDKWKVLIGRLVPSNGELDVNPSDGYRVITNTRKLEPGQISTESYLLAGAFDHKSEADNFEFYLNLKFTRFLIRQTLSSVNITKDSFRFVPCMDFSKRWTDEALYNFFSLTKDEIKFIDELIRNVEVNAEVEK